MNGVKAGALLLWIPILFATLRADQPLEQALRFYTQGKFEEAVELLRSLLYPNQLFLPEEQRQARQHLAFSYVFLDQTQAAEEEFRNLLFVFPDYEMDSRFVSPRVVAIFNRVRQEPPAPAKEGSAELAKDRVVTQTQTPLHPEKKKIIQRSTVGEWILIFSPAAGYYYYKKKYYRAWGNSGIQILGLGLAVGAYLYRNALIEEESGINDNNFSKLETLRSVQIVSFSTAMVAYLWSVLDAGILKSKGNSE